VKKINLFLFLSLLTVSAFCQLDVKRIDGGSVVTKLTMGIKVNDGSSLSREFIVINSPTGPLQLSDVGINTVYNGNSYNFVPVGTITPKEPITAYEIHHVLYNVFGKHMKTLSNKVVTDINENRGFSKFTSWYASENNVEEYLICVSYIANVRNASNLLWHYDVKDIQAELNKIKLKFDESYEPPKLSDKEK
jgi:hypothetical protein